MRTLIVALFTLLYVSSFAQTNDKKIDDIIFLYVDEKYDKVVDKSISLSQNDKYKKHPLPLIYAAMGYYQMSRRPESFPIAKGETYQKPLKSAQKYCAKFLKKDSKENQYYDDYKEFYDLLADTTNKLGQHYFLMEEYRKGAGVYKYGFKALKNDPIIQLWEGICEIKSQNSAEGDKNILGALEKIDENFEPSKVTAGVLAHGMLLAEEYLTQKGDSENARKAKKLVEVFKKYDPDELDKAKMEERKAKARERDAVMRKFYSGEDDETEEE